MIYDLFLLSKPFVAVAVVRLAGVISHIRPSSFLPSKLLSSRGSVNYLFI